MWMVIYMAKGKELIMAVQELLTDAWLAVRIRPIGGEKDNGYFEILVPETEAQIAHMKLLRYGF
jgi:hypothetical protein